MDFQTKLSDQELQEFKEAFSVLDKSGRGNISIAELADFLRSLGAIDPTTEEIAQLIKDVDVEQKGGINYPQFLQLMEEGKGSKNNTEKEIKCAFKLFHNSDEEANENITISVDAMQEVLQKLGENISKKDVEEMIHEIEQNNSGVLTYQGFRKIMTGQIL